MPRLVRWSVFAQVSDGSEARWGGAAGGPVRRLAGGAPGWWVNGARWRRGWPPGGARGRAVRARRAPAPVGRTARAGGRGLDLGADLAHHGDDLPLVPLGQPGHRHRAADHVLRRLGVAGAGAARFLHGDVLAGDRLDDVWAGDEPVRGLVRHHHEVGDGTGGSSPRRSGSSGAGRARRTRRRNPHRAAAPPAHGPSARPWRAAPAQPARNRHGPLRRPPPEVRDPSGGSMDVDLVHGRFPCPSKRRSSSQAPGSSPAAGSAFSASPNGNGTMPTETACAADMPVDSASQDAPKRWMAPEAGTMDTRARTGDRSGPAAGAIADDHRSGQESEQVAARGAEEGAGAVLGVGEHRKPRRAQQQLEDLCGHSAGRAERGCGCGCGDEHSEGLPGEPTRPRIQAWISA